MSACNFGHLGSLTLKKLKLVRCKLESEEAQTCYLEMLLASLLVIFKLIKKSGMLHTFTFEMERKIGQRRINNDPNG